MNNDIHIFFLVLTNPAEFPRSTPDRTPNESPVISVRGLGPARLTDDQASSSLNSILFDPGPEPPPYNEAISKIEQGLHRLTPESAQRRLTTVSEPDRARPPTYEDASASDGELSSSERNRTRRLEPPPRVNLLGENGLPPSYEAVTESESEAVSSGNEINGHQNVTRTRSRLRSRSARTSSSNLLRDRARRAADSDDETLDQSEHGPSSNDVITGTSGNHRPSRRRRGSKRPQGRTLAVPPGLAGGSNNPTYSTDSSLGFDSSPEIAQQRSPDTRARSTTTRSLTDLGRHAIHNSAVDHSPCLWLPHPLENNSTPRESTTIDLTHGGNDRTEETSFSNPIFGEPVSTSSGGGVGFSLSRLSAYSDHTTDNASLSEGRNGSQDPLIGLSESRGSPAFKLNRTSSYNLVTTDMNARNSGDRVTPVNV